MKITQPTGRPLHFGALDLDERRFWLACDDEDVAYQTYTARRYKETGADAYHAYIKTLDKFHNRADTVERKYGHNRVVEIMALAFNARKKDYDLRKYQ